ncbi:MAG: phosphohistidine phosphatase SixA [Chitinivibrionales bacterium]|nr:phosphohistidine phosphatase SixA [Chitinivibrionales bacterium]
MEIILVRHGIAVDRTAPGISSDEERTLTDEGIAKTRNAARGLKEMGVVPQRIISSPLVRARQTAEVVASVCAPKSKIETSALLSPGEPLSATTGWLEKQKEINIMLVGHMPDTAELASLLLSTTPTLDIRFKKAAACCISFTGKCKSGAGCLEWLLQPKHLRMCRK